MMMMTTICSMTFSDVASGVQIKYRYMLFQSYKSLF